MGLRDDARDAILNNVIANASEADSSRLLKLAEAFAWATQPGHSHGGHSADS